MNFLIMNETRTSNRRLTLRELFAGFDVAVPEDSYDIEISGMADDSRQVKAGDLFVAVPGHATDGRKYIAEASSLGAAAILTSPGKGLHANIPIILSSNLRSDMGAAADRFYDHPSSKITVAGITGTNGKTTTAFLLATIFETSGKKWGRIGTIGCDIAGRSIPCGNTTPGSIDLHRFFAFMVEKKLTGCAMEVSSHALDQNRTGSIRFSSATFTNLSQDHLDYHQDMESYFAAKAKLFMDIPVSVINIDDEYGPRLIDRAGGKVVTFSSETDADLKYGCAGSDMQGSILEFRHNGQERNFKFPLPGWFNHQNAAAAAATAIGLGLTLDQAIEGLCRAAPIPGRLEPVDLGQPFAVYVDYAHTPNALERLLTSLRRFSPNKLHVVFGCGGDRDRKKRPLMGEITSNLADHVYLTSDNPRTEDPRAIIDDTLKGIADRSKCTVIEDRLEAIKTAISKASKNDIVAIAGKGHEDYQVIGTVKKFFSDIEVAGSVLRKLGYGDNG
jgi:UDP-N-acetylmuramoyl-L-alanyl-D-glutamate--2,6-diaminopimelate ligase